MKNRKKRSVIWTTPKNEFEAIVNASLSIADILRHFGLAVTGGHHKSVKARILMEGIVPKFIKTSFGNRGQKRPRSGFSAEQVFVKDSTFFTGGVKRKALKLGLIENKCSVCGLGNEWNSRPLVLVLDHINGVRNDHRINNLRLLCPNCNSQQPTFAGRNRPIGRLVKSSAFQAEEAGS